MGITNSGLNLDVIEEVAIEAVSTIESTAEAHVTKSDNEASSAKTKHDANFNRISEKTVNVDLTDVEFTV